MCAIWHSFFLDVVCSQSMIETVDLLSDSETNSPNKNANVSDPGKQADMGGMDDEEMDVITYNDMEVRGLQIQFLCSQIS